MTLATPTSVMTRPKPPPAPMITSVEPTEAMDWSENLSSCERGRPQRVPRAQRLKRTPSNRAMVGLPMKRRRFLSPGSWMWASSARVPASRRTTGKTIERRVMGKDGRVSLDETDAWKGGGLT